MDRPLCTTTVDDDDFGPRQAAALLDQAIAEARRTFTPGKPALWVFRAVLALVALGGFWLSVRGQDPYSGPTGASLLVAFVFPTAGTLMAIAIAAAAAGFGGPVGSWLIMAIGLAGVCLGTAAFTAWRQRRSVVRL